MSDRGAPPCYRGSFPPPFMRAIHPSSPSLSLSLSLSLLLWIANGTWLIMGMNYNNFIRHLNPVYSKISVKRCKRRRLSYYVLTPHCPCDSRWVYLCKFFSLHIFPSTGILLIFHLKQINKYIFKVIYIYNINKIGFSRYKFCWTIKLTEN